MQSFDYVAPKSAEEVVTLLADQNGDSKILCGGTDLLVQLREGRRKAGLVIDIKNIPELTQITFDPQNKVRIGAAASCHQICNDPNLSKYFPGLVDAISLVGGLQLQNRASVGGNLCNASPAADSIPALIVHEAICNIIGPNGSRALPVEEFCIAPGKNALQAGEFLTSIDVPAWPEGFGASYLRFIPRNEMDIAVVGVGASVELDASRQIIQSARIGLGAVAPTPLLAEAAGDLLAGKQVSDAVLAKAAEAAKEIVAPISDMRGTQEYRVHATGVLVQRVLKTAIARARGESVAYRPGH